jgi:hypothetical protein
MEADAAYTSAKYNAALARQNANWTRQETAENARQQNVEGRKQLGEMRASYGISGVTIEGSAFDVLEQSALAAKRDELNIQVEGARKSRSLEQGAELTMYQGKAAQQVGYYKGTGQAVNGVAQMFAGGA